MFFKNKKLPIRVLFGARAFAVGLSYYVVADIPGVTSTFVAIFAALLPFDLIVAMPKFTATWRNWRDLFFILIPRISATAITLITGLGLGVGFGALVQFGLPVFLGAISVVGFAYSLANQTKNNVSSYVGIIAGLSVFEQVTHLTVLSGPLLSSIGGTALRSIYATFGALFAGWAVGIFIGVLTRLFLPRGYRSTQSEAYEQPLSLQPLKAVTHMDEQMQVFKVTVEEHSALAYQALADTRLRSEHDISVLSIYREPKDVVTPRGSDIIYPGDVLVVVAPTERADLMIKLVKGSVASE